MKSKRAVQIVKCLPGMLVFALMVVVELATLLPGTPIEIPVFVGNFISSTFELETVSDVSNFDSQIDVNLRFEPLNSSKDNFLRYFSEKQSVSVFAVSYIFLFSL